MFTSSRSSIFFFICLYWKYTTLLVLLTGQQWFQMTHKFVVDCPGAAGAPWTFAVLVRVYVQFLNFFVDNVGHSQVSVETDIPGCVNSLGFCLY